MIVQPSSHCTFGVELCNYAAIAIWTRKDDTILKW